MVGGGRKYLWEFPSNSLMELPCKPGLVLVASVVVDCTAGAHKEWWSGVG
jgi:hypothetical protein